LEGRNICREYCMDLVSLETPTEDMLIRRLIQKRKSNVDLHIPTFVLNIKSKSNFAVFTVLPTTVQLSPNRPFQMVLNPRIVLKCFSFESFRIPRPYCNLLFLQFQLFCPQNLNLISPFWMGWGKSEPNSFEIVFNLKNESYSTVLNPKAWVKSGPFKWFWTPRPEFNLDVLNR